MENQLINIKVQDDKQLVSARDLHKGLGVTTRFSLWAKRNFKNFKEGVDFEGVVTDTPYNSKYPNGKHQKLKDYMLTIEMAKHVAMMSGTNRVTKFVIISFRLKKHGTIQRQLSSGTRN